MPLYISYKLIDIGTYPIRSSLERCRDHWPLSVLFSTALLHVVLWLWY